MGRLLFTSQISYGLGGSMSEVVGLPNNSYKPITNVLVILIFYLFLWFFDWILELFRQLWGPSWPWSHGSWIYNSYAISAYYHWCCVFESRSGRGVQHYVIKFDSDLRQVGGFLRVLWFPPPIKLTATI